MLYIRGLSSVGPKPLIDASVSVCLWRRFVFSTRSIVCCYMFFFILCCFVRSFVTMTDGLPPRPSVCYYRLIRGRCRMQNEDKNAGKMHKCIKLYSVGQNSGATDS